MEGFDSNKMPTLGGLWKNKGVIYKVVEKQDEEHLKHPKCSALQRLNGHSSLIYKNLDEFQSIQLQFIEMFDEDRIYLVPETRGANYKFLEQEARRYEKNGEFSKSKNYHTHARTAEKLYANHDLEEKAVEENRYIRKEKLNSLGAADRKLYEMKGLKPFIAYRNQCPNFLYWE